MGSPPGGSTFSTSAPSGTRREVAYGPGRQMLRSSTRTPVRKGVATAIGRRVLHFGWRIPSSSARLLFLHRGHGPVRPRGLQRVAPARPHARAIQHRRDHLWAALGPLTALPDRRGGHQHPPRTLPLHDALPPARRVCVAAVRRPGPAVAGRGPLLRSPPPVALGPVRAGRLVG